MAVIIGSARIDENGNIYGGKAGDQTGFEVATEEWYRHAYGWRVFRCIEPDRAAKIADDMLWACENDYIGYDQHQDQTLYQIVSKYGFDCRKVKTPCETDCARLVRVCVLYAGINIVDFYTVTEAAALLQTGMFKEMAGIKYTESSDYLRKGDILVTPKKGHTVVVITDGKYEENKYDKALAGTWQVNDGCYLNMRTGAGTDYKVVQVLGPKTKVKCDGYYKNIDGTKWLSVDHDGVKGYCSTKYMTQIKTDPDNDPVPAQYYDELKAGTYRVTGDVNMRRGAGTRYKIIEVLKAGTKVVNYGYYSVVGATPWLFVQHGDNVGYCSSNYLKKV